MQMTFSLLCRIENIQINIFCIYYKQLNLHNEIILSQLHQLNTRIALNCSHFYHISVEEMHEDMSNFLCWDGNSINVQQIWFIYNLGQAAMLMDTFLQNLLMCHALVQNGLTLARISENTFKVYFSTLKGLHWGLVG